MKSLFIFLIVFTCCGIFAQKQNCKPIRIIVSADDFQLEYNENDQLVKVTDRYKNVFKLYYNENGELVKSDNFESDGDLYDTYIYKQDKVEQHDEDGLYITYIYEMVDGKPVKIIESEEGDKKVIAEFVWKDGNVVEQTEYKRGVKTVHKFQYDNKPNVLSVLRFYVDFINLLNYAEIFSKNNVVKITTKDKVFDLPIEYNEQGCVYKMPRDHYGVAKEIIY